MQKISINDIIATVDREHTWKGNILQTLAEEIVRYTIPLEEVIKINLSTKLLKEIAREIINKEIVKIQINGKPRLGKSTVAILLGLYIDKCLKEHSLKKESNKFGVKNIARDQNEFMKRMRNPELMYDIIITDESNSSENTGENATVEEAQRKTVSDVQAVRYIHEINVCPEGTMDHNTDIKIEVRNKDNGLEHTRIYYHLKSMSYYGWVLIGIADFDVRKLIANWLKVEDRFNNYLLTKNETDKKFVEYWRTRDFYVEYMCRKHEKIELMKNHGINRPRDLDYAEIRKAVVDKLKPLAEMPIINMNRLTRNVNKRLETEFKKRNMPLSILGRKEDVDRIMGYLGDYRTLVEIRMSMADLLKKFRAEKIEANEYNLAVTTLAKAKTEIEDEIKINEEELESLSKLNKRYNEVYS